MAYPAYFWINNLAGATLAASAETADGPVANLVKPQVVTAWRALASSAWFTADFGGAAPVRVLALLGVALGAGATLRLRLSSSAAHAGDVYDSGVISANAATVLDGRKQCLLVLPATYSAQYAKVDLADGAAAFIDVGWAFLGDWFQFARAYSWGFTDAVASQSNKERALGGQFYTQRRPKQRIRSFTLNFMSPAEAKAQSRDISDRVGDHAPFGMIPDPAAVDAAQEFLVGILSDLGTVAGTARDTRSRTFELTELL